MSTARAISPILCVILLAALTGCKGDYDWRTEHRGVLKSIGGYEKMMLVTFEDGSAYKVPLAYLAESDPWGTGQEVILQTERIGGGPIDWRFRSIIILDPGDPKALPTERIPTGER